MTITVTRCQLTFVEAGDQRVTYPAGTVCSVYNRQLKANPEADEMLARVRVTNKAAGEFKHLVMIIAGRPRILPRESTISQVAFERQAAEAAAAAASQTPPQPVIPPATPAEVTAPKRQQKSLF